MEPFEQEPTVPAEVPDTEKPADAQEPDTQEPDEILQVSAVLQETADDAQDTMPAETSPAPDTPPQDADAQAIAAALELIRQHQAAAPGTMFTEPEPEPEAVEPPPQRHTALRVLAGFFAVLVLGFAVFCIIWDVKKGTSSGGGRTGAHVEIIQQAHPVIDSTLTDADGKYTTEGIAETIMPSIVEIYTYSKGQKAGSGSGIILTADGYIATNAHVVADADVYTVRFFNHADDDEKQVDAKLIGHDTKTDLAVIKVDVTGLKPAVFGNSDQMKLGEKVCALGNPAGLSGSISTGIISGINRKVRASSNVYEMDCFQTDAAISPGNSGGALVNMYGQVIGITSSKYASSMMFGGTAYEGLGFAITVNAALPILKELTEQGYVSGRVRVGISFLENEAAVKRIREEAEEQEKTAVIPKEIEDGSGVRVMSIDDDSDLKNTVLKEGDWILTMNGSPVSDYDSLNAALNGCVGGDKVHCRCGRIQEDGTLDTFEIDFKLLEDHSGEY